MDTGADVGAHQMVELRGRDVQDRRAGRFGDSCAIDQSVETPEPAGAFFDQRRSNAFVVCCAGQRGGPPAHRADRCDRLLDDNGIAPVDDDAGTEIAEQFGHRAPDAATPADHHRGASGQQTRHVRSPIVGIATRGSVRCDENLSYRDRLPGSGESSAPMVDGCSRKSTPSTGSRPAPTSSTSAVGAHPSDYAKLLIQATDIVAPEPFKAGPPTNNPNGQPGVATTFTTEDGIHVIHDTIQVLADGAAATNALNAARARRQTP